MRKLITFLAITTLSYAALAYENSALLLDYMLLQEIDGMQNSVRKKDIRTAQAIIEIQEAIRLKDSDVPQTIARLKNVKSIKEIQEAIRVQDLDIPRLIARLKNVKYVMEIVRLQDINVAQFVLCLKNFNDITELEKVDNLVSIDQIQAATQQYKTVIVSREIAKILLFRLAEKTPLKVFASAFECYPNTFVWYVWRDYDKKGVFGKIEALQTLNNLNR